MKSYTILLSPSAFAELTHALLNEHCFEAFKKFDDEPVLVLYNVIIKKDPSPIHYEKVQAAPSIENSELNTSGVSHPIKDENKPTTPPPVLPTQQAIIGPGDEGIGAVLNANLRQIGGLYQEQLTDVVNTRNF